MDRDLRRVVLIAAVFVAWMCFLLLFCWVAGAHENALKSRQEPAERPPMAVRSSTYRDRDSSHYKAEWPQRAVNGRVQGWQ